MADAGLKLVKDHYSGNGGCTGQVIGREYQDYTSQCIQHYGSYQKYTCSGEGEATIGMYSDSLCSNLTSSSKGCNDGAVATCADVVMLTVTSYSTSDCTGDAFPASKYALGCTPTGSNGPASLKVEVSDSGVTEVTHYTGSYNCAGTPEMSWSSPCGGVCTLVTNAGGTYGTRVLGTAVNCRVATASGDASQGQGQFNPLHAKGHDMCSTSVGPEGMLIIVLGDMAGFPNTYDVSNDEEDERQSAQRLTCFN